MTEDVPGDAGAFQAALRLFDAARQGLCLIEAGHDDAEFDGAVANGPFGLNGWGLRSGWHDTIYAYWAIAWPKMTKMAIQLG